MGIKHVRPGESDLIRGGFHLRKKSGTTDVLQAVDSLPVAPLFVNQNDLDKLPGLS